MSLSEAKPHPKPSQLHSQTLSSIHCSLTSPMTSSYTFFVHNVCITQVCFHCSIGKPCDSFLHLFSQCVSVIIYIYIYVTVHEKTRYKLKIAILNSAHLKVVQTLCYFMLKSDWPNGDKITSVRGNAILSSAFYSSLFILISSET